MVWRLLVLRGRGSIEALTTIEGVLLRESAIIHWVAIGIIVVVAEPPHGDIHVSVVIRVVHVSLLRGIALMRILVGLILLGRRGVVVLLGRGVVVLLGRGVLLGVWLLGVLLVLSLFWLFLRPPGGTLRDIPLTLNLHGLVVPGSRCLRNAIDLGVILIQLCKLNGVGRILVDEFKTTLDLILGDIIGCG